jgi:hypothetical protein
MAADREITGQLSFVDPTQQALRSVAICLVIGHVHELAGDKVQKFAQITATKEIIKYAKTEDDFHFWRRMTRDYKIRARTAAAVLGSIDKDIRDQGLILLERLAGGHDSVPLILAWLKGDKDAYLLAKLKT